MSRKIIKVDIAGLGRNGWGIHGCLLEPLKSKYKVVAVYDPNPERMAEARSRFKCRSYNRFHDMLKDNEVELLINATPSHLHSRYSIEAMKAGKHVVCEKPMARSLAGDGYPGDPGRQHQ